MDKKQPGLFKSEGIECQFCKIVKGSEDSYKVFEDKDSLAFLDNRPLFPGHILLVPKLHYSTIEETPDSIVAQLFINAKKLSKAVENALKADGTFIALNNNVSQSVPHVHIHIVPRKFKDGLKGFFWPRYKYAGKEEMADAQAKIIAEVR